MLEIEGGRLVCLSAPTKSVQEGGLQDPVDLIQTDVREGGHSN
jgi:hypothetical protein